MLSTLILSDFWPRWIFDFVRAFSSGKRELLFIVVHGLLIVVASLVVEHRL